MPETTHSTSNLADVDLLELGLQQNDDVRIVCWNAGAGDAADRTKLPVFQGNQHKNYAAQGEPKKFDQCGATMIPLSSKATSPKVQNFNFRLMKQAFRGQQTIVCIQEMSYEKCVNDMQFLLHQLGMDNFKAVIRQESTGCFLVTFTNVEMQTQFEDTTDQFFGVLSKLNSDWIHGNENAVEGALSTLARRVLVTKIRNTIIINVHMPCKSQAHAEVVPQRLVKAFCHLLQQYHLEHADEKIFVCGDWNRPLEKDWPGLKLQFLKKDLRVVSDVPRNLFANGTDPEGDSKDGTPRALAFGVLHAEKSELTSQQHSLYRLAYHHLKFPSTRKKSTPSTQKKSTPSTAPKKTPAKTTKKAANASTKQQEKWAASVMALGSSDHAIVQFSLAWC
jgi:exonuclease III